MERALIITVYPFVRSASTKLALPILHHAVGAVGDLIHQHGVVLRPVSSSIGHFLLAAQLQNVSFAHQQIANQGAK